MTTRTQERYPTVDRLVARAVHLKQLGYVVLVLSQECEHWTGYSAFRPWRIQKRDNVPEDMRILLLDGPRPQSLDLSVIYKVS